MSISYEYKADDSIVQIRERKIEKIKQIAQHGGKFGDKLSDVISRRSGVSRSSKLSDSTKNKPTKSELKNFCVKGFRPDS